MPIRTMPIKLAAIASVALACVLISAGVAGAAPPQNGTYLGEDQTHSDPWAAQLTVSDNKSISGYWNWGYVSCEGNAPGSYMYTVRYSTQETTPDGLPGVDHPIPIAPDGSFRVSERTYYDSFDFGLTDHTLTLTGQFTGDSVTGTIIDAGVWHNVNCASPLETWHASLYGDSGATACDKAKAKVSELKQKLRDATNPKKKRLLKRKLKKAKKRKQEACS